MCSLGFKDVNEIWVLVVIVVLLLHAKVKSTPRFGLGWEFDNNILSLGIVLTCIYRFISMLKLL